MCYWVVSSVVGWSYAQGLFIRAIWLDDLDFVIYSSRLLRSTVWLPIGQYWRTRFNARLWEPSLGWYVRECIFMRAIYAIYSIEQLSMCVQHNIFNICIHVQVCLSLPQTFFIEVDQRFPPAEKVLGVVIPQSHTLKGYKTLDPGSYYTPEAESLG